MPASRPRLARALAGLEESERLLLALTRVEGLELSEAAEVLGTSPAAAARDLQCALRKVARAARTTRARRRA